MWFGEGGEASYRLFEAFGGGVALSGLSFKVASGGKAGSIMTIWGVVLGSGMAAVAVLGVAWTFREPIERFLKAMEK